MKVIQVFLEWAGVLLFILGAGTFIGSFNSLYTASLTLEMSRSASDTVSFYDVEKLMRALELFMLGTAWLIVGFLLWFGSHHLKRRVLATPGS